MPVFNARLLAIAFSLTIAGALPAFAESFKPIVIINTYPPNGPDDVVGRSATNKMLRLMTTFAAPAFTDVIAAHAGSAMGRSLDRIVNVERRPYARGVPGIRYVVTSGPDGDTLLFCNSLDLITQPRLHRLPYALQRDLTPVGAVARMPIVMIARADTGPVSVRAFLDMARSAPGKLNYASSGDFRSGHLAGELFMARTGLSVVHVAYNGGNEAVNGVIKGQVSVGFVPLPSVLPAIPGGKIRVLGVADRTRHQTMPGTPTIGEAGVPEFEAAAWFGIYAPAGTSAAIVESLNSAMVKGLRTIQTERLLLARGLQARYPDAAEFGDVMEAEMKKWTAVLDRLSPPY